jgi:hypothetical protein
LVAFAGLLIIIATGLGVVMRHDSTPAQARAVACQTFNRAAAEAPPATDRRIRLKPEAGADGTKLVFGTLRDPRVLVLRAIMVDDGGPPAGTQVNFEVGRFTRDDQVDIPAEQLQAEACVSGDGQHINVALRVDPASVAPGTYDGTVVVDDGAFDSLNSLPIKLSVVLKDPRWYAAVVLLAVAALAAAVGQRALRLIEQRPTLRGSDGGGVARRLWRLSVGNWEFPAGLLAAGAATVPVYIARCVSDPSWSYDFVHGWGLLTTAFAAASAGYAGGAALVGGRGLRMDARGGDR